MDEVAYQEVKAAAIEQGIFSMVRIFSCRIGIDGIVESLLRMQQEKSIDILAALEEAETSEWQESNNYTALHMLRQLIKDGAGLDVLDLFKIAAAILNAIGDEKDYGMTSEALAHYVSSHADIVEVAADIALTSDQFARFVADIVPHAIVKNKSVWLSRLFQWMDAKRSSMAMRAGLSAMNRLSPADFADLGPEILARSKQALQNHTIDEVGLAVYVACRKWERSVGYGRGFSEIISMLFEQRNAVICCNIASLERGEIGHCSKEELDSRLRAFSIVDLSSAGFEHVDAYLAVAVAVDANRVVEFVEAKLDSVKNPFSKGDVFKETFRALRNRSKEFRSWLITRWLLSDGDYRMSAVQRMMHAQAEDEDMRTPVDVEQVPQDFAVRVDLLRHGIGWLFGAHYCCVSFAVSGLALFDDESLSSVERDFFDMIVMNYSDLVEKEMSTGELPERIRVFLKKELDAYTAIMRLVHTVPCHELEMSSVERAELLREQCRQHEEIMKCARENSILRFVGSEVKVLYGNGAIVQRMGPNGQKSREEIPFQRHEARVRIPGMLNYNELSLQSKIDELRYTRIVVG